MPFDKQYSPIPPPLPPKPGKMMYFLSHYRLAGAAASLCSACVTIGSLGYLPRCRRQQNFMSWMWQETGKYNAQVGFAWEIETKVCGLCCLALLHLVKYIPIVQWPRPQESLAWCWHGQAWWSRGQGQPGVGYIAVYVDTSVECFPEQQRSDGREGALPERRGRRRSPQLSHSLL